MQVYGLLAPRASVPYHQAMVRDRKSPYAPSAPEGGDGSYARPPGKFALTDALGSAGRSNVAPKRTKAAAGAGDKPETTEVPDDAALATEAKEAAPAPAVQKPAVQKLPRLDLGRRGKP